MDNPGEASGLDFSQIPASDEDKGWNEGAAVGDVADPAWAEKSGAVPRYVEEDDTLPPPRRKWGLFVAVILILAVVFGGIYVFAFKRSAVDSLFSSLISSKEIGRYKKFYDRGRENFLLDSESYFQQADREYQKVLALEEDHPATLAALGEMYAVWAQYLRDAKVEAVGDAKGQDRSEAMNREIDRLNDQYEQKLAEALRWIEQAKNADELPAEVHRVSADIKRLQGDIESATKDLHKARAMGADPETEYVASMLDLESGKPAEEVEATLGRIIETKPLIRAMYRRARLQASIGKVAEAKEMLGKIFQLNSDHTRAQDLAARIDDGKPIPLLEIASETDGQDDDPASGGDQKPVVAKSGDSESPDAPVTSPTKDEEVAEKTPAGTGASHTGGGASARVQEGRGGGRTDSMLDQATRMQKSGKTATAMKLFEAILSKEPNNLDALCGLGDAYLDKGAFGRAIANYRRALRVNSSFGPALLGLAEAFKSLTQNEQAVKYYESYLRAHPNGRQAGSARRNVAQLRGPGKMSEPEGEEPKEVAEKTSEAEKKPEENRNAPAATAPASNEKGAAGEGSEESEE